MKIENLSTKQRQDFMTFLANTGRYTSASKLQGKMASFGMETQGNAKLLKYESKVYKKNLRSHINPLFARRSRDKMHTGQYLYGKFTTHRVSRTAIVLYAIYQAVLDGVCPPFYYYLMHYVAQVAPKNVENTTMKYRKLERYVMEKVEAIMTYLEGVSLRFECEVKNETVLFVVDDEMFHLNHFDTEKVSTCRALYRSGNMSAYADFFYYDEFGNLLNADKQKRQEHPDNVDPVVLSYYRREKLRSLVE